MIAYGIVVHGGAGAPDMLAEGCEKACAIGFAMLKDGAPAIDAAAGAIRSMEDDGRFNAGSGSVLRLDGVTREMDAAVMDSVGKLGVVISMEGIKNPVLVARAITGTPHVALSGMGASNFALKRGFEAVGPVPDAVRARYERMKKIIAARRLEEEYPHWKGHDVAGLWNFDTVPGDSFLCDTVGAVAMDRRGLFAVAGSTGGASPMLLGRVGDTAMIGCGFYAGPVGAIAVTGLGEEMVRRMTARSAYDLMAAGMSPERACAKTVAAFPAHVAVGIIAITHAGIAVSANRTMPAHGLTEKA